MSTYRQIAYMCLDELKLMSDDADFNEDHVYFLMNKYRNYILKQKYLDIKKEIPESNYQTICVDLEPYDPMEGQSSCETQMYLRSTKPIPYLSEIASPKVFGVDYYTGEITYVSRERMKYVGENKYLQNFIYSSLGPDTKLYLKSQNPQFLYLKKAKVMGVFEDAEAASKMACEGEDSNCDFTEKEFPLEEALIPILIQSVTKELYSSIYRPDDDENNAKDDLATIAGFIRRNLKSEFQRQMQGE